MSNPGSATTHSSRASRPLTMVMLVALVGASAVRGDIGIRKLNPSTARAT